MPSLIDIRRRIKSVKNTRQITKALKMVSAAKLRRAQDRVIAARPYNDIMRRMLANVAVAVANQQEDDNDPLLDRRPEKRIQLLVITADVGKAGAFNANTIRAAQDFMIAHPEAHFRLELMGRKGRDFFRRRDTDISGEHVALFQKAVNRNDALEIARSVMDRFRKGEIDAVYLIGNTFKSVASSKVVVQRMLPVEVPEQREEINYIYEQDPKELLAELLPRYVEGQIFRSLLESSAAEHAARMTAMESASKNAGELIDKLTLNMNRVRQASITREIIEIVSGASALD